MSFYKKQQQQRLIKSNQQLVNAWIKLDSMLQSTEDTSQETNNEQNILDDLNLKSSKLNNSSLLKINSSFSNQNKSKFNFNNLRPQTSKSSFNQIQQLRNSQQALKKLQQNRPNSAQFTLKNNFASKFSTGNIFTQKQEATQSQNNFFRIQSTKNKFTSISRPISSIKQKNNPFFSENNQQQQMPNINERVSKVASLKSLMNLRAQSRPHKTVSIAANQKEQTDIKVLQSIPKDDIADLLKKSESIHSLHVDQVLDLFTAKCLDQKVEYKPDQAVKFIDKIKKQCKQRAFCLQDQGLGIESAYTLAHIFQNNEHFQKIILEKNNLGDSGVALLGEALRFNNNIIHLNIASNDINQDGFVALFESLEENNSIISLDLGSREGLFRNKLNDFAAENLGNLLRYANIYQFLRLQGLSITLNGIEFILQGLQASKNLVFLDISNNLLGSQLTELIFKYLPDSSIQHLDLSKNDLGDQGIVHISDMYSIKPKQFKYKTLILSHNSIQSTGFSRLLNSITKNPYLEELIFDNNKLSGKLFQGIQNFLWENQKLRVLNLENCFINKEGGEYLGYGLTKNKFLVELYLGKNQLKDYGVKILASSLKENDSLKILDLQSNSIGDDGGIALGTMLGSANCKLEKLNLKDNKLHDYSGILISESMRENMCIVKLNIDRNPISYKFMEEIYQQVQINILERKKQRIPNYISEMQQLQQFENKKYTNQEKQIQLTKKQREVQKDLNNFIREKQKDEAKEYAQSQALENQLNEQIQEYKEIINHIEQCAREFDSQKTFLDLKEKKLETNINQARQEIKRTYENIDLWKKKLPSIKRDKEGQYKYQETKLEEIKKDIKIQQAGVKGANNKIKETIQNIDKLQRILERYDQGLDSDDDEQKKQQLNNEQNQQEGNANNDKNTKKNQKKGGKKQNNKKARSSKNLKSLKNIN